MDTPTLTINILLVQSILYLFLIIIALVRADFEERTARALVFYGAISCLWVLEQVFWQMGWLDFLNVSAYIWMRIPLYGVLLSSLLFLHLTRTFLRLAESGRGWWIFVVGWVAVLATLDGNLVPLPEVVLAGNGWLVDRTGFIFGILFVGWGIPMAAAAWLTFRTYRETHQPLHRNRIKYWLPTLGAVVIGDILLLAGYGALGSDFRLLGMLIATYAVITHRLPDVRQAARRAANYLLITLLTVGIYTAGLMLMQYLFQAVPGYNPLLAGAAVALILVILSQPLLGLVRRLVNWLIFGASYDPSHILSEYSTSISNILDLERLATVAIGLIHETLEIERGILFVVHHETRPNNDDGFRLQGIKGMGDAAPPHMTLSGQSPVSEYLCQEHRALTQYDIDLLPHFQEIPETERTWFSDLQMEVYLPIYAKGDWIGLLALGPKMSGDRYFDDDLMFLNTLADQTAVALENARLVEDLRIVNQDLEQAYADLDRVMRRLQELDKLKSAFIGVITHELRTPFANITFSLELLDRHGRKHLPEELHGQLEQVGTGTKAAKRMVDNLVTFATFLSKQGELHPAPLDFAQIIQDSLFPLKSLAEAVGLTVHIEMPEELPPLHGDRERLADAIYHLMHNAIKFTEAGGNVSVRCQVTANALRFEVEDTGVGVPIDKLPTLWEGFTQMADPLRRGVEGLGLGLALVKYVVNAHGGEVWARSEEGVGSVFGFGIPLDSAEYSVLEAQGIIDYQEG
jgi:signal transduction histidine kinase